MNRTSESPISVPHIPPAPGPSSEHACNRMKANRGRDTAPELAIRRELHRRGFRYRVDSAPLRGLQCRGDLVFSREQLVVFVDGCFWHGCPRHRSWPKANGDWWKVKISATVERDRRNDAILRRSGWTVVRIWEHEDVAEAANQVAAELNALRQNLLQND
jgi:DNA mismatch endonuclease, patch repair protein